MSFGPQGPQCGRCEPFYVGNPSKGGACVPCLDYCNQHTNICVEAGQLDFNESSASLSPSEYLEVRPFLCPFPRAPHRGPQLHPTSGSQEAAKGLASPLLRIVGHEIDRAH